MTLHLLPLELTICRLDPTEKVPSWAEPSALLSLFRGSDELSIICESRLVPAAVSREEGWCAFKLAGQQPFTLTGVLSSILTPLAAAEVSILAVSTFDTDYVLVKREQLEAAATALTGDFDLRYKETDLPVALPLETERLTLRGLRRTDEAAIFAYAGNRENTTHMAWLTHRSPEDSGRYLRLEEENALVGRQYNWGVVEKKSGQLIGTAGISRLDAQAESGELGFILHRSRWGVGYAGEAAEAVLRFAFETVGLKRVDAYCFVENDRSRRVLDKLDMRYLGVKSVTTLREERPRRSHHYELLAEEFALARGEER